MFTETGEQEKSFMLEERHVRDEAIALMQSGDFSRAIPLFRLGGV